MSKNLPISSPPSPTQCFIKYSVPTPKHFRQIVILSTLHIGIEIGYQLYLILFPYLLQYCHFYVTVRKLW